MTHNRNAAYWDKRSLRRLKDSEKISDNHSKRIRQMYNRAYQNINEEIENIWANYSKKTGLDVVKLKELVTKHETKKLWKDFKQRGYDKYILKNYKARINRAELVKAQIYRNIMELYKGEKLEHLKCYSNIIKNSYTKTIRDVATGINLNFNFSKIDSNLIKLLLKENWSGKNYSQRIWKNMDILADTVSEIVGGALISGQDYAKTSRQIRDRFNVSKYYADRLIRTESNYYHNQADAIASQDMGIEKYVFMSVLDNRTSLMCQDMDGEVIDYKDMEIGYNYPPLHPNCRSTVRAYIDEEAEAMMKGRRARDPKTGKSYITKAKTYKEWKKSIDKKYGKDTLKTEAKKTKKFKD